MLFNSFYFTQTEVRPNPQRGFGLVELMVSISIMTLVSTVILVKNRSFNNALLLRNQAYEVAFSLRQAQLLAVSGTVEAGARSNQYGIHFDITSALGDSQYRMFRDEGTSSGWYEGNGTNQDVVLGTIGQLDSRFKIADITDSSDVSLAGSQLSITFIRPNFDGIFFTANGSRYNSGPVYIKITPKDDIGYASVPSRVVEITSTGQISVK